MRYWIIRHKVSHAYLPQPRRGGATWYEPEPLTRRRYPPRLFTNEGDAKKALSWWYDGPWDCDRDEDGYGYPCQLGSLNKHRIEREKYAGEMEVHEVWIEMKGRK